MHLTEGFDFLGFTIRHYPAPKTTKSGYKLLITPSKQSIQQIRKKLGDRWQAHIGANIEATISHLNPVIRGWANYFRPVVASATFGSLDTWMFKRQCRWTTRTHPTKSNSWKHGKYWGRLNLDRHDHWVFGSKWSGAYMLKFSWFKIERHVMVKGNASPDDRTLRDYWWRRTAAKAKNLRPSHQKIARRQAYVCPLCGESLFNDEELHTDHIEPRQQGGKDSYANLRLVHLYCHQQRHSRSTTATHE